MNWKIFLLKILYKNKIDFINKHKNTKLKFAVLIISLFTVHIYGQTSRIEWFAFSTGFGESASLNTTLKTIIGDPIVGTSSNEGSSISSGFFSNPASTGIVTDINEKSVETIPTSFQLNQNYPNPFNPTTNIKFSVNEQSTVKIIIYDLLGRKVKTLLDEVRNAGNYIVNWNGENELNNEVSSGIYFYNLTAIGADNKKFISTKKMILLR